MFGEGPVGIGDTVGPFLHEAADVLPPADTLFAVEQLVADLEAVIVIPAGGIGGSHGQDVIGDLSPAGFQDLCREGVPVVAAGSTESGRVEHVHLSGAAVEADGGVAVVEPVVHQGGI